MTVPSILWAGGAHPGDEAEVRLLQAALEAIHLLSRGWTRQNQRCDIDEYEPDVIRFHLNHWGELTAAAHGMSSAGAEPIGSAGEVDARRTLIAIKSDLELGTDLALADILHWRSVVRIYKRQERWSVYLDKRASFTPKPDVELEPWGPLAESACIRRIATRLGWRPHLKCEAA